MVAETERAEEGTDADMIIPETIKIGGLTYLVKITDNLKNGSNNNSGEIDYHELIIRMIKAPNDRQEEILLHEVVHAMFDFLGYTDDEEHGNKRVEEIASVLHMIIKDNPDMFRERAKHD